MTKKIKEKDRIWYIDEIKGIGILLVVLGHMGVSHEWCTFITTFHIPLFFFIGGYLFNIDHYRSTGIFLIRKTKRIIVPYLLFSLISLLASCCRNLFGQYEINLKNVLEQFGVRGTIESNLPLWFMRTFFVVEVLFFFIKKLIKKNSWIALILLCCLCVSFGVIKDSALPFSRTFNGLFFYGAGYLARIRQINFDGIKKRTYILCFVMLFSLQVIVTYFILKNSYTINIASIDHIGIFMWSSMIGIMASFALAMLIGENKLLEYMGKNSMIIMCTHILVKDAVSIACTVGFGMPKTYITDLSNIKGIILGAIIIILEIPLIEFINHFMPLLTGKTKG